MSAYSQKLERVLETGVTTEHSFRGAFEELLNSIRSDGIAVNEPRRAECGAPDFVFAVRTGAGAETVGYVECKDVGTSLATVESSDQLKRYLAALPNLILTDYLDFRWYVNGQLRRSARLGRVGTGGRVRVDRKGEDETLELLAAFAAQTPERISDPEELALRMARLTRMVRDVIVEASSTGRSSKTLEDLRGVFARTILPEFATPQGLGEFADMFSQTIAYGLFAARLNHRDPSPFARVGAARDIPKMNPLLRQLFDTVGGVAFADEPYSGFIDDLAQLLARADIDSILEDFAARTGGESPVFHFYETYLASYDPLLRDKRGVYITPRPVVTFIVRAVDSLLRAEFRCKGGLANSERIAIPAPDRGVPSGNPTENPDPETVHRVLVLDPACGTGTFLYEVVDVIRSAFKKRDNAGLWQGYVSRDLLPRVFGFELLMAPYAVAHFQLGMQLAGEDLPPKDRSQLGCTFTGEERLGIYLTNTLEAGEQTRIGYFDPLVRTITDEAAAASRIKRRLPIIVILGNPPYSGESGNKGEWISSLVEDYKKGIPALEHPGRAKWLQNDYVKFIRFGQWKIDKTGSGILAFITDRGYLDNTTFVGMRRSLLATFSEISILDLHGGAKKHERTPSGAPDGNVFDIQQGVCITLFVKRTKGSTPAIVRYAEVWGTREEKYEYLSKTNLDAVKWTELQPSAPYHEFLPMDSRLADEYNKGWAVPEIFTGIPDPAPGIVTTQDEFAISFDESEARDKVARFLRTGSESEARELWKLCRQDQWSYSEARRELATGAWRSHVIPLLYRPFDRRWTVFDSQVAVHRRERVMRHMTSGDNLALVLPRRVETQGPWNNAFVADGVVDHVAVSGKTIDYVFPLYLYARPEDNDPKRKVRGSVLAADGAERRKPNVDPRFSSSLSAAIGLRYIEKGARSLRTAFGPEDVFDYAYAVLHSPGYAKRFETFLKRDFPRIPLPKSKGQFRRLVALGRKLRHTHLADPSVIPTPRATFPVPGTNVVGAGAPKFHERLGRIYISPGESKGQYFGEVPVEVWRYRIGGYSPLAKWLKDRRGRPLSSDDLESYLRIIEAIRQSLRIEKQIEVAFATS